MTRTEVGKVLALLSAYYDKGQRSMDVKATVAAWHYVIGEYDYDVAKLAVIEYAKNDTRDYASFPSAGVIRKAIENELAVPNRIFNHLRKGIPYEGITDKEKTYIGEKAYNSLMSMREEALLDYHDTFVKRIRTENGLLLEGEKYGD